MRGRIGRGMTPVVLNELLRNRERGQRQRPARVISQLDREIGQRGYQGIFIRGREQALSQQPLCIREKADLFSRRGRLQLLFPVLGLLVDNPPDTAARVGHISLAPGNDVHMGMFNGLTGSQSIVHADVEAIGLEFGDQPVPYLADQIPNCGLLIGR